MNDPSSSRSTFPLQVGVIGIGVVSRHHAQIYSKIVDTARGHGSSLCTGEDSLRALSVAHRLIQAGEQNEHG